MLNTHGFASVAAPAEGQQAADANSAVPAKQSTSLELTAAIAAITSVKKVYSESKLPPSIPISYKRWKPEWAPDAPHDPHAYFPMKLVK